MGMQNNDGGDLWQDFLDDDEKAAEEKRPVTDGSQWVGQYDRRKKPRDENGDSSANAS